MRLARGRSLPGLAQMLLRGKAHYLLAGILLGLGFSAQDEGMPALRHAQISLMTLLIGWMGLELGLHLEYRSLRRMPSRLLAFDAGQSLATFLLALTLTFFFLPKLTRHLLEGADPLVLAVLLSAAATVTVPWRRSDPTPDAEADEGDSSRPPTQVLGNVTGLLLFGGFSLLLVPRPPVSLAGRAFAGPAQFLVLSLLAGIGIGLLLDTALRVERERSGAAYLMIGLAAVAGGICVGLGLPALFVGLLSGAWLINATLRRRDALFLASRLHPAMEGIFLVFAGSMIGIHGSDSAVHVPGMVKLALLLFLSRAIAKTLAVGLLWRLLPPSRTGRDFLGTWVLPQGSLAVAICVQPLFVAAEGPMQAVNLIGGMAAAMALSQAAASTFHPPRSPA
jgi:hypothetical protein